MEKHLSSFLKKQGQHEEFHYFIIGDPNRERSINKVSYIFQANIIPNKVIKDKNFYSITYIDEMYYIDGFIVTLENNKVHNIKILGIHPNCDPTTDIYCLPDFKKEVDFTKEYLSRLITNIETYYLDNCHFIPTRQKLKYEKLQSLYIKINPK